MAEGHGHIVAPWRCVLALGAALWLPASGARAVENPFNDCIRASALHEEESADFVCCRCFYEVARSAGLWAEAERLLQDRLETAPVGERRAWLHFYLGSLHLDRELLGRADAAFAQAQQQFVQVDEAAGAIYSLINRSRVAEADGALEVASRFAAEAAELARLAGLDDLRAETRLQEGRLRVELGADLGGVRRELEELGRDHGDDGALAFRRDLLLLQARVDYELGDWVSAQERYSRGIDLLAAAGDAAGATALRFNLLSVVTARNRPADRRRVVDGYRRVLADARSTAQPALVARSALALARYEVAEAAPGHLQIAREAALAAGDPEVAAQVDLVRAQLAAAANPTEALQEARRALEVLRRAEATWALVYSWAPYAEVLWEALEPEAAVREFLQFVAVVDELRTRQERGLTRAQFLAPWTEMQRWLLGRLLQTGRPQLLELAWAASESMRARTLLEALEDPARRVAGEPEGGSWLLENVGASSALGSLQASLGGDEAVLSFAVSEWQGLDRTFHGGSWLIVVTRESTTVHRLPGSSQLTSQLEIVEGLLRRRGRTANSTPDAIRRVSEIVLGDALDALPAEVRRLIVVPDGPLWSMPLAALEGPSGGPLIDHYQLVYVPSSRLWEHLRSRRRKGAVAALALVAPEVPRAASDWAGRALEELPASRREGRLLRRRFGPAVEVLSGSRASGTALRERLGRDLALVHLASHAIVGPGADGGGLALAADAASPDGRWTPAEIEQLDLANSLVVLASCQSAAGPEISGEGLVSFARAFLIGGAGGVVANLWPVEDARSAVFFELFYEEVRHGARASEALAAAQKEARARGWPTSDWAGWMLIGGSSDLESLAARARAAGRSRVLRWTAILGVLMLCLGWLVRRSGGRSTNLLV